MHCYAFAPPCVMSLDLAVRCRAFITSIVLGDDLVPRLCFGSMEDFKKVVKNLLSQKDGKLQRSVFSGPELCIDIFSRLFQIAAVGNNLGESLTTKIATYLKCSPTPDL